MNAWQPRVDLVRCLICGAAACIGDDLCRRHGGARNGREIEAGWKATHA